MPAAVDVPVLALITAKDAAATKDAAEAELQRRQRRLSGIASAAKEEVMQLRSERARLATQLQQLAAAVKEVPQPPEALADAHAKALRCLKATSDGRQGEQNVVEIGSNRLLTLVHTVDLTC